MTAGSTTPAPSPVPGPGPLPVTVADVETASRALRGVVRRTALERSVRLSDQLGRDVFLKREDLQKCRSFKVRGAYARMSALTPAERQRGVVCASAGNHAQGVAYACSHLQVHGTIYLPSNTPRQKRQRIETIGGDWVEQVIVDGTFDRANSLAQEAARASGRTYVHAYDDPMTIAGQGTVAVELAEQIPEDTTCVLVPVGGGGLLAGVLTWLAHVRPDIRVIGVEPEGAACMRDALEAGHPVRLDRVDSFVDGTAVGRAGDLPFEIVSSLVDRIITVPEGAVCTEMLDLYQSDGVIAEPAGALASAAARMLFGEESASSRVGSSGDEGGSSKAGGTGDEGGSVSRTHPGTGIDHGSVVCLVSGGNNDLTRYAEVMERSLRHEGLRHYFLVTFPQQPGALRLFLGEILGPGDDIVHFEYTKKNNRDTGPALVGIDLSHREDIAGLRRRMEASPLHVEEIGADSEIFRLLI